METQNISERLNEHAKTIRSVWRNRWHRLRRIGKFAFWLIVIYMIVQQVLGPYWTNAARVSVLDQFQQQRKSRVIAMIHRQETISLFGVPVSSYINIEDSEAVLRAIRLTPPDQPIDMILHTPGGLVLAAEQIAKALAEHKGKVTAFVPHYAMSGGTLIALAGDEIVMDPNAVLGPVDPQLGTQQAAFPAASVLKALAQPNPNRDDQTLILGDLAEKALRQVKATTKRLLLEHHSEADAERIATKLASGEWTHDYALDVEELRALGVAVQEQMPREVYELMDLFPQTSQRRPGVEFIPLPYAPAPPPLPRKTENP